MSIAVDRNALGPRPDHRVERARKARGRLQGQPIDQINVDRTQPAAPGCLDDRKRLGDALHAVDGLLHASIEVLNAQADAIETELREHRDITVVDVTRIELDREITLGGAAEAKAAVKAREQLRELRAAQEVRRPAPEMQLDHFATRIE